MLSWLVLAASGAVWAQRGGMGGSMPAMPALQNPTPGSGAAYHMTVKGKEMDIAAVALGNETVEGNQGIWMELRMNTPDTGGEMVWKTLTVNTAAEAGIKRMIVQRPGQAPMEMPSMMMGMMHSKPSTAASSAGMGELVGTETVTVPAGTFTCQHYRKQGNNGPVDVWISKDVTPYAMVKMASGDTTMELTKVLTNETSHIKGEPSKFQLPHF
jgi:hypothetical protein